MRKIRNLRITVTSEHVSLAPETSRGEGCSQRRARAGLSKCRDQDGAPLAGSMGVATFLVLATIAGLLSAPLTGLLASLLLLYIPFSTLISSK